MENIKIKFLPDGPMRLSVMNSDEESFDDILFGSNGKVINIKKNSIICRCGKSKQQPFCDGVHRMAGFKSSKGCDETLEGVKAVVVKHGSLEVEKEDNTKLRLCRCGASENMPYCDGIHTTITSKKFTF